MHTPVIRFIPGNTPFSPALEEWTRSRLSRIVNHFGRRITRIEVHFESLSAARAAAPEMRCLLEARADQRRLVIASHQCRDPYLAADIAARRLHAALERRLDRAERRHRRRVPLHPHPHPHPRRKAA